MTSPLSLTAEDGQSGVRPSVLKGKWYESTPLSLEHQVDTLLRKAGSLELKGDVRALISPHSGYMYSGLCAAHAYKIVEGRKYKRVIILAPSHYGRFKGFSLLPVSHYETPLGLIEVDRKIVQEMLAHPLVVSDSEADLKEHSLEIQLPFLQRALSNFQLVPLLVGPVRLSYEEYRFLAQKVKQYIDSQTLLVISSDFTHYGPRFGYVPFDQDIPNQIQALDSHALAKIEMLDFQGFLHYLERSGANPCGFQSIALLLQLLPEEFQGRRLHYMTSGMVTGDYCNSVSYAAMAFTPDLHRLNLHERQTLLSLSRETLEVYLRTGHIKGVEEQEGWTDRLKRKGGVFVTLQKEGKLRGCIGTVMPNKPLYESVRDNTIHAAVRDPRFPSLSVDELDQVTLEISILSALTPLTSLEDLQVGKHGLMIRKQNKSGLLLPKVAADYRWDRRTFLENLCFKANLRPHDWQKGAEIYCFTAQSFGEPVDES